MLLKDYLQKKIAKEIRLNFNYTEKLQYEEKLVKSYFIEPYGFTDMFKSVYVRVRSVIYERSKIVNKFHHGCVKIDIGDTVSLDYLLSKICQIADPEFFDSDGSLIDTYSNEIVEATAE